MSRAALELDWLNGNVKALRARYERACRVALSRRDRWSTIERPGRKLRLLIHEPTATIADDCAIVYFHGGGWIAGSPETHADVARALCETSGLRVVSVDYRLAPEHKAPAPIEDGSAALDDLFSRETRDGGTRYAILCGDSAGGSIAMAVGRSATTDIRKRLLGVCSLYGCFGLTSSSSLRAFGNRDQGLDRACIRRYWRLAHGSSGRSPYSIAALETWSGPPVYLMIAGMDPLRDDSLALARALKAKGVTVAVDLHEHEGHGFLQEGRTRARLDSSLAGLAAWMRTVAQRGRR